MEGGQTYQDEHDDDEQEGAWVDHEEAAVAAGGTWAAAATQLDDDEEEEEEQQAAGGYCSTAPPTPADGTVAEDEEEDEHAYELTWGTQLEAPPSAPRQQPRRGSSIGGATLCDEEDEEEDGAWGGNVGGTQRLSTSSSLASSILLGSPLPGGHQTARLSASTYCSSLLPLSPPPAQATTAPPPSADRTQGTESAPAGGTPMSLAGSESMPLPQGGTQVDYDDDIDDDEGGDAATWCSGGTGGGGLGEEGNDGIAVSNSGWKAPQHQQRRRRRSRSWSHSSCSSSSSFQPLVGGAMAREPATPTRAAAPFPAGPVIATQPFGPGAASLLLLSPHHHQPRGPQQPSQSASGGSSSAHDTSTMLMSPPFSAGRRSSILLMPPPPASTTTRTRGGQQTPSPTAAQTAAARLALAVPSASPSPFSDASTASTLSCCASAARRRQRTASDGSSSDAVAALKLRSGSTGSWHMAKDVRRCSDHMNMPAPSPEGQREQDDGENETQRQQAPAAAHQSPPQASQQQIKPRRRLWSPDESGVPGLALLTGEMRELALADADGDEDKSHRGRLPSDDSRCLRTPSPPAKPLGMGEGEWLRRWMAAREGTLQEEAGQGRGGGPLRPLDGNARRPRQHHPHEKEAACKSQGRTAAKGSSSIIVHLPLQQPLPLPFARPLSTTTTPSASRLLLPALLQYLLPLSPSSPCKGWRTLVVVTRPRIKVWEAALKEHFGEGKEGEMAAQVMVYTAGVRERARLPLASVARAPLVLTTWEVLLARDVALGEAAETGAWLGTGQQRNGRRAAPTATAGVAVGSRLMQLPWARVLVDEAQRLRGPAQRVKCAEGLSKLRADHRWLVLDGTALLPAVAAAAAHEGGKGAGVCEEWGPREDERARCVMALLFGEEEEAEASGMARSHRAVGVFHLPSQAAVV